MYLPPGFAPAVLNRPSPRAGEGRRFLGLVLSVAALLGVMATAVAADAPRVTFAELAACPLVADAADPRLVAEMPATLRVARDGRVRLTGYMLPLTVEAGRARQFLLMRNQNACCFGQMPAANEYVVAEAAAPGLPVRMDAPVTFEGRLRIAPVVSGGAVVQFYNLEDAALSSAAR